MNHFSPSVLSARGVSIVDNVVRSAALRTIGISGSAIAVRCGLNGPWQRPFPGVLLLHNKIPQRRELLRAALAYAGPGAVVTGVDAVFPSKRSESLVPPIHILIPAHRRVAGQPGLLIERTTRLPSVVDAEGIPCAPATRAVLDLVRREQDASRMRWALSEVLRQGLCTTAELHEELSAGSQRGSAKPRLVLHEIVGNSYSSTRFLAEKILRDCPLPRPQWNVSIADARGALLGTVDAWWSEVGLAWQVIETNDPASLESRITHNALISKGMIVLRTSKPRLVHSQHDVRGELMAAFDHAISRMNPTRRQNLMAHRRGHAVTFPTACPQPSRYSYPSQVFVEQ